MILFYRSDVDMVWRVIANELGGLGSIWWETPEVVEKLDAFRRVGIPLYASYT